MTDYYKELLGSTFQHRVRIDKTVIELGSTLTVEQQVQLCKPFNDADIKEVMFSIPNQKSPGPDGYNSGFFKDNWDMVGNLVCSAIKEFFSEGSLPEFYGQTKLTLLPKVAHPKRPQDFRPISCCNVIYKCITKLVCARLKEVLPHLIDAGQGAFVQGRELLFNVLLCQDLARGYNRKHTPQLYYESGPSQSL